MKRVLILGATGGTGREAVLKALARGYDVTVLVRHPDRLPPGAERAHVVVGDVLDPGAVEAAVRGQDAIVSALGVGKSFKPGGLIAQSVPITVKAAEAAGVRRIVFTSAYGVGETYRDTPLLARIFIFVLLRDIYADKTAGEEILRRSGLDWTIVCPTTLTDKPGTGQYRIGERLELRGLPTIARADVADFLVGQIADRQYVRKGVLISR
jgi:uncharacterized protein YbjT (DUF2867 family)